MFIFHLPFVMINCKKSHQVSISRHDSFGVYSCTMNCGLQCPCQKLHDQPGLIITADATTAPTGLDPANGTVKHAGLETEQPATKGKKQRASNKRKSDATMPAEKHSKGGSVNSAPPTANASVVDAGVHSAPPSANASVVDAGVDSAPPSANASVVDAGVDSAPPSVVDAGVESAPPSANASVDDTVFDFEYACHNEVDDDEDVFMDEAEREHQEYVAAAKIAVSEHAFSCL